MLLIDAIARVCQEYPEHTAVEDSTGSLSYSQLWEQAQILAQQWASESANFVILQDERCCRLLVHLMAVWQAGHTPLLLDPLTPQGRVDELVALLRPSRLLQGEQIQEFTNCLDSRGEEYLVTTSGSSGQPKLVRIPKGNLYAMVEQQIQAFGTRAGSRCLWMLSPGFDASLSDIGTTFCSAGTLICAPADVSGHLPEFLVRYKVTQVDIPPSVLALYRPGEFPRSLETIVLGGEASEPETLRTWAGQHRLVAVYGPSEVTVCSSMTVVDTTWNAAYIGLPLRGVSYRVEDGELWIAGQQVGLGYLHGEDFDEWYKTGDLVGPAHPQHGLQFLGRRDRQVQVRGRRVELEELERLATEVLGHRKVAVLWEENRLSLFWQCEQDAKDQESALRQHFSRFVVPALMPQDFISLVALPRLHSGKLALPELRAMLKDLANPDLDSLARLTHLVDLKRGALKTTAILGQLSGLNLRFEQKMSRRVGRPKLLVTGSTGHLGRALMPLLLEDFDVWCLTRTPSGGNDFYADLSLPDLGMEQEQWDTLKGEVSLILNLAGDLALWKSFEQVKAVNALSLLKLSELGCPIHHASSLAVELSTQEGSVFGAYAQSKWLAETILESGNVPGYSLRYGQLLGTPQSTELLALVIRGLIDMACCPPDLPHKPLFFDLSPVNWAAQRTRDLLREETDKRKLVVLRRAWEVRYSDLISAIRQFHSLEEVPAQLYFELTTPSHAASIAQRALWKCDPTHIGRHTRPDFDLFLLGNGDFELSSSQAARDTLSGYVELTVLQTEPTQNSCST